MSGVGEAGTELRDILPTQGGFHKNLDVVADQHQLTHVPVHVDAAGSIGDDQLLAAQQTQHPHGVGHFLVGIALVVVHTALHDRNIAAVEPAEDQLTLMTGSGGCLEVRDLTVGNHDGILHQIAQITQSGTEDHGHAGDKTAQTLTDGVGAFLIFSKCVMTHIHRPPIILIDLLYTIPPEKSIAYTVAKDCGI